MEEGGDFGAVYIKSGYPLTFLIEVCRHNHHLSLITYKFITHQSFIEAVMMMMIMMMMMRPGIPVIDADTRPAFLGDAQSRYCKS